MTTMAETANTRPTFVLTPWYHWLWTTGGISILVISVFAPHLIPYSLLGPIGSFLHYMNYSQTTLLRILVGLTVAVHVGEAIQAYNLTRRMNMTARDTILWTGQTFYLGFTSLFPLKAIYQKSKKQ